MPFELEVQEQGRVVIVKATGKLTAEDYARLLPALEKIIQEQGKICCLCDLVDFHGWELAAAWEDVKFGYRHVKDLQRIAMVGDRAWEKWAASFCKPFISSEIRYFDRSERDKALEWTIGAEGTSGGN